MVKPRARRQSKPTLRLKVRIIGGVLIYSVKGPSAAPEALSWLLEEIARDVGS